MPATAALPEPARPADPAASAALSELIQLGMDVARLAAGLARVEGQAHGVLAAGAEATRNALAAPASLGEAIAAGRDADADDAARNAAIARVVVITGAFEKAARSVRRTVMLQARLASGRPFHSPSPPGSPASVVPAPVVPAPVSPARHPANDAEHHDRPDRAETGDELGHLTDEEVLHAIDRDLAAGTPCLAGFLQAPATATNPARPPGMPPDTPGPRPSHRFDNRPAPD